MMRIGGFCFSIVRTCTGEVWVRSTCCEPSACLAQIERVVHLPRRMIGRDVQLGEIVVVELDVRAFGDGEAEIGEDRGDLVQHLADRMDRAAAASGRGGSVTSMRLGGEPRVQRRVAERGFARGDGLGDACRAGR